MRRSLGLGALATAMVLAAGLASARTDVVIAMQLEPPHLDPTAGAAGAIDQVTYANVFETLTRFDQNGGIVPGLAKSWEVSPDGLVYTFHLHEGVTFSDGTAMDAADVKFSLDRARAADSTNAQKALFAGIASVEAVDARTVKVTLSQPNGNFHWNMAWGDAAIVAPESAATNQTAPVGTGPFVVAEWVKGDRVILKRREGYWGPAPKLTEVTFRIIADPTAAFAAMMAGDIDAYPAFPAPENLAQFEADPRFVVTIGNTEGETILSTNNALPPLDNVKVRAAIAHALDRKTIIDGTMYGYGTPIGTHFAPHHPAYVDLTAKSAYDPALSRKLLAEAGLPDGFTTTLKLPPPSYARRSGEIIAAQLAAVGIKVEISNLEWAQWLEEVFKNRNYGLTIVSHTEPFDIGIYARDDYYFNYKSDAMKAIMKELDATSDAEARNAILARAQEQIANDYVNGYLFQLPLLTVAKKGLVGLWPNAPTQATDMTAVYWEN